MHHHYLLLIQNSLSIWTITSQKAYFSSTLITIYPLASPGSVLVLSAKPLLTLYNKKIVEYYNYPLAVIIRRIPWQTVTWRFVKIISGFGADTRSCKRSPPNLLYFKSQNIVNVISGMLMLQKFRCFSTGSVQDIDKLLDWSETKQMKVHINKCKVMQLKLLLHW